MRILKVLLVSTLAATPLAAQNTAPAPLPADSLQRARQWVQWLYAVQMDSLWAHMDAGTRQQLGSPGQIEERWLNLATQIGDEQSVTNERWVRRNGQRQYWRTAVFPGAPEAVLLRIVMLPDGTFAGIGINPASQAPAVDPEP